MGIAVDRETHVSTNLKTIDGKNYLLNEGKGLSRNQDGAIMKP